VGVRRHPGLRRMCLVPKMDMGVDDHRCPGIPIIRSYEMCRPGGNTRGDACASRVFSVGPTPRVPAIRTVGLLLPPAVDAGPPRCVRSPHL
jgi:hypothetical protein